VQKGHDATRFALQCFGGAGGQHACLVADELGMETVFIHPYAGVLSAYGMGLADQAVMREQAVEVPFAADEMAGLEALVARLAQEARKALAAQGAEPERIEVQQVLHLRYAGTDTALVVPYGAPDRVVAIFTEAHRARFGFATPERPLVVEALAVEATTAGEPVRQMRAPRRDGGGPAAVDRVVMWTTGAEYVTPVFERTPLRAGDHIAGPALIREANATAVVEPGWTAELTDLDHMVLRRAEPRAMRMAAGSAKPDPVLLELFNNLFMNVAEQTGDPRVLEVYRRFAQLRMRLQPYLRAQARVSVAAGKPLMRALCFEFPDDPRIWDFPYTYLLGDDLLVLRHRGFRRLGGGGRQSRVTAARCSWLAVVGPRPWARAAREGRRWVPISVPP